VTIYTKTGDGGETSFFGGGRVPKDDIRVAAYGSVDELNSALGVAIATGPGGFELELLERVQSDLLAIGGRLASPDPEKVAKALDRAPVTDERVADLEAAIDRAEQELPALTQFLLPGGTLKAAQLHVARTACRRAERHVVALSHQASLAPEILRYLNRLSDLLFVLARLANLRTGATDRTW
jgi:cob(I)alamin adenosyltransferase